MLPSQRPYDTIGPDRRFDLAWPESSANAPERLLIPFPRARCKISHPNSDYYGGGVELQGAPYGRLAGDRYPVRAARVEDSLPAAGTPGGHGGLFPGHVSLHLEVTRRQEVRNWAGLLQRLATSRGLDALRRRIRRETHLAEPADLTVLCGSDPTPPEKAQAVELGEQLRRALSHLPGPQAEAFCLRHLSEMSYEQVASQMGQSIDAVGVLLHRGRARLRELLMSTYGDECNRR